LERVKSFIINHKYLMLSLLLFIIVVIIMTIALKDLLFSNKGGTYGNRLDGISDVVISEDLKTQVIENIMESEKAESVKIDIYGKNIYITIDFKTDVSLDDAKVVAVKSLSVFNEKEQAYYDFQYILTQKSVVDNIVFPSMGAKHKASSSIVWIKE